MTARALQSDPRMTVRGASRDSRNATVARCALATTRPPSSKDLRMPFRRVAMLLLFPLIVIAACGDDNASPSSSVSGASTAAPGSTTPGAPQTTAAPDTVPKISPVEAAKLFPADRCEANKAAGKITYLSSFDFSASASIVEVIVAKQKGYFDDMCL